MAAPAAAADLVPTALSGPSSAVAGSTVSLSWTVKNQGTIAVDLAVHEAVYLSSDSVWGAGDTLLASFDWDQRVNAGASYNRSRMDAEIPQVSAGEYWLILVLDDSDLIAESNEGNNTRAIPLKITRPDLVVTAYRVDYAGSNQTSEIYRASWTVTNQGDATATAPWWDKVDAAISQDDFWYERRLPLAPGESYHRSEVFYLENSYHDLLDSTLIVDADETLPEANRENNRMAYGPGLDDAVDDLALELLTMPAAIHAGKGAVDVAALVHNRGETMVPLPLSYLVHLSADQVPDDDDIQLWLDAAPAVVDGEEDALLPGASIAQTLTVPLHTFREPVLNLFIEVDTLGWDATTSDNSASGTVAIAYPNLVVTEWSAPATAAPGQVVTVEYAVENQGAVATHVETDSWNDYIFIDHEDYTFVDGIPLGSSDHTTLAAGEGYRQTTAITLPVNLSGTYTLSVHVDYAVPHLFESNRQDNVRSSPIAIGAMPDLAAVDLQLPAHANHQFDFPITLTVQNQGQTAIEAQHWYSRVYFSADSVLDESDTMMGFTLYPETRIAAGASYVVTETVRIPQVPAGEYYLLLVADHADVLEESNEQNNILAVPFPVRYGDLEPTAFAVALGAPGEHTIATWTVRNADEGLVHRNLNYWNDGVYLSRDQTLSSDDAYLARTAHSGGLEPDASYTGSMALPNLAGREGQYYFILVVDLDYPHIDRTGVMVETNEANNQMAIPVYLGDGPATADPKEIYLPAILVK